MTDARNNIPTILVIEDNDGIRENIAEMLEVEGYAVFTAKDGAAGIEVLLKEPPSLVISDVHMPLKNGFDVLAALRENRHTAHIPFVFLTSDSEKRDIEAALLKGANGYISKPFNAEVLFETVKRLVIRTD